MTARTWKIVDMVGCKFPGSNWGAELLSGDDILVWIKVEGDVSKETAEEIVNQFAGKTVENAAP